MANTASNAWSLGMVAFTRFSDSVTLSRKLDFSWVSDLLASARFFEMLGSRANLMRCADRLRASSRKYQETTWLSADKPSPMARAPARLYMLMARNRTNVAIPSSAARITYQKRESSIWLLFLFRWVRHRDRSLDDLVLPFDGHGHCGTHGL